MSHPGYFCELSAALRAAGITNPNPTGCDSATPQAAIQKPWAPNTSPQLKQLVESAIDQTKVTTGYDPAYVGIDYPGGDVPLETGVCSDVVVRAFRKAGIDLQKEIHDDMGRAWSVYPKKWGAARPDSNIDHRRVLNLMTYFDRQGKTLPITTNRDDYLPGDIVTWDLSSGIEHIGIVVNTWSDVGEGLPDSSQHWRRRAQRGRVVELENHRALPVLLNCH